MTTITAIHDLVAAPKDGNPGEKGDMRPFPYPCGVYDSAVSYTATATTAPFVLEGSQYYIMAKTGTWAAGAGSPSADYAAHGSAATWILFEKYKAVWVEIFMADFAKLASAIFSGDYMLSQHGTIDGKDSDRYDKFSKNDPDGKSSGNFAPNTYIDFLDGIIRSINGVFLKANIDNCNIHDGVIYNQKSPWMEPPTWSSIPESDNIKVYEPSPSLSSNIYSLEWTADCAGRKITIICPAGLEEKDYNGTVNISAPIDKWFYLNGTRVSEINITRQIVELYGYGNGDTFFGWIVTNIRDVCAKKQYGKPLNILAQGVMTYVGENNMVQLDQQIFCGGMIDGLRSRMGYSRTSVGVYKITLPAKWNLGTDYLVMLTGIGYSYDDSNKCSPIKATLKSKNDGYFEVWTSDDASVNDGSFEFQIFNLRDL